MTLKSLGKKTQKAFGVNANKCFVFIIIFIITNVIGYMTVALQFCISICRFSSYYIIFHKE